MPPPLGVLSPDPPPVASAALPTSAAPPLAWRFRVLLSRWLNRARYLRLAPTLYRNWWTLFFVNLRSIPSTLELRSGLKYQVRPRTGDLGVINEAVLLNPYLRPGWIDLPDRATVVDIGANIGDFALQAAWRCPRGKVYAVEPLPEHCQQIRVQLALNALTNVEVVPAALGAQPGELDLFVAGSQSSLFRQKAASVRVQVITLDQLMRRAGLDRIDLLKMDCEGAEWDILPGLDPLLPRLAQIAMEYHNGKRDAAWLQDWLQARGFEVERTSGPWNGLLWARRPTP